MAEITDDLVEGFPRNLLAAIMEGADALIAALDMDRRYVAFNSAYQEEFQRLFGARLNIGVSVLDVLPNESAGQTSVLEQGRRTSGGNVFYEQSISPILDNRGSQIGVLEFVRKPAPKRCENGLIGAENERAGLEAKFQWMNLGVMIAKLSGDVIFANPAALSLLDLPADRPVKQYTELWPDVFEIRHPDGPVMNPDEWPIARATRGEIITDCELLVRNKRTGKSFIGSFNASPVRNELGEAILLAITVSDITDRIRVEQALRESEERVRLAMQAVRMCSFEWNPATDEVRRSYNYAEMLGITGDATRDTGDGYFQRVHPADRERFVRTVTSLTPATDTYVIQYEVIAADGHLLTLRESGRGFFDTGGRMTRLIGVVAELTQPGQAEAARRETEERFSNMADAAPVMIWLSGPDKLCTFFNKAWLDFTGRTMAQELGQGWCECVHPEDLDYCMATYSESFDTRRGFQMEYRLRRADGDYRWVLDTGVPRFESGGVFAGYIGSGIDINDLKRAQQEALARQKLESVGLLARGIAHDFNNLLGGILADAELALTDLRPDAPEVEGIGRIKAVALRASEIVRELMIYAGQDTPALELVDISSLVDQMLPLFKISISKRTLLETDLGRPLPGVLANPAQIRQVLMNLVTNASEAIGDRDGVIRVATSRVILPEGEHLLLEVSDTGCGMTTDMQAKIFGPFFTTRFAGRGLGLAVVKGIVRSHGGLIHLVSAEGQGTKFQMFLPCAVRPAPLDPTGAEAATEDQNTRAPATILMVEDEETIRLTVSKMLRKRGFAVIEAGDGAVAIELLRAHENEVRVILLDMTIPGASSREVVDEAQRLRPDIKVILTTAYSRNLATASPDWLQVEDFIRKPYQINDLVRLLQDVLDR